MPLSKVSQGRAEVSNFIAKWKWEQENFWIISIEFPNIEFSFGNLQVIWTFIPLAAQRSKV